MQIKNLLLRSVTLAILLVVTTLSSLAQTFTDGDFTFRILDAEAKTVELIAADNYLQLSGELTIPSTAKDDSDISYTVVRIGKGAFDGASQLSLVYIPKNITEIWGLAFANCTILNEFIIEDGESILSLAHSVFSHTPITKLYLGRDYTLPDDGNFARYDPFGRNLKEVQVGPAVTTIGYRAFYNCPDLNSVKLGESIKTIESEAFAGPNKLESIVIPKGVSKIGDAAFGGCSNLSSISLPQSVIEIGNRAFSGCSSLSNISLPESLIEIGDGAFSGCSSLSNISLPESLIEIGDGAFGGCSNITEVSIPGSVLSLGDRAFSGCTNLKKVIFEDGNHPLQVNGISHYEDDVIFSGVPIESISIYRDIVSETGYPHLFHSNDLKSLKEVSLGGSLTEIWPYAFYGATALTSIAIPNGVTKICNSTFQYCSLLSNISLPESLLEIGTSAFSECSSLSNISLPESLIEIGSYCFSSCSNLASIKLPNNLKSLSESAFIGCIHLTSIHLPQFVESIGDNAFWGCTSLSDITFNNNLQTIGTKAFSGCTSLKEVTIPASVVEIGSQAFDGCYFGAVTCLGDNPAKIALNTFIDYVYISADLIVPDGTQSAYSAAEGWKLFKKVNGSEAPSTPSDPISLTIDLSVAGELINYVERGQVKSVVSLKISGEINGTDLSVINLLSNLTTLDLSEARIVSGGEPYYESNGKQWRTHDGVLDRYWLHGTHPSVIELPQVTTIGTMACADMPFERLTIPTSVRKIGDYAFTDCPDLVYVDITDSVASIGDGAFYGCGKLSEVSLGYSVANIGSEAFAKTALTDVWSWNPVPPAIAGDAFDEDTYAAADLHVYEPSRAKYWLNSVWGNFADIDGMPVSTPIQSIRLDETVLTVDLRSSFRLSAIVNPSYATIPMVEWRSSDESVATVDNQGLVKAVAEGEAVITAYAIDGSGVESSCIVTVVDPLGIDRIDANNIASDAAVYDLSGRKISRITQSGIYIINSTKLYIRK